MERAKWLYYISSRGFRCAQGESEAQKERQEEAKNQYRGL